MSADLIKLVQRLGKPRVLVLGDIMLDRYVWGDAERISQEAPVILLHADRREERLGGASSVASMLIHLGAEVVLAGVIGQDEDAQRVRAIIDALDIDQSAVLNDSTRPTTVKERYIGRAQHKHPQQILRVDFESRLELSSELEAKFLDSLEGMSAGADVVLISDYDKGVCTPRITQWAIQAAGKQNRPVLVDPIRCKPGQGQTAYEKYRGCSTMTPNRVEANLACGLPVDTGEQALHAARLLLQRYQMQAGIVTLDKDGMALVQEKGTAAVIPTRPRQVYDITGAGDMVLSVLGIALAAGADYAQAVRLANVAGGLEVEKIGVAPVTREEIIQDLEQAARADQKNLLSAKMLTLPRLQQEIDRLRSQGRRIVFTNGCFDLLHAGHVQYLKEAKDQGDILVVGLNSDLGVRNLKGPSRPVHCQSERALVLAALASVDFVNIFDAPVPKDLILALRPDVLVKGADYRKEEVVGAREVESWGGRVHLAVMRPGCSTTGTILRMLGQPSSEESSRKVA